MVTALIESYLKEATAKANSFDLTLSTPLVREDTLLYPRVFSFQSTKFLGREGMDIKLYEVGHGYLRTVNACRVSQ